MSERGRKRRRTHYGSDDDDYEGDAVAPQMICGIQRLCGMIGDDMNHSLDQTRHSVPVHNLQPSSSFTNTPGFRGLETKHTTPQPPRPVIGNVVIGRNNYPCNNDPFGRLVDPESDPCLKEQEKHFQPFTGASRNLRGSYSSEPSPEATVSAPMHSYLLSSVGFVVDSFLPSTHVRVKLPDGTVMTGHFNYHHTVADIRSFIDASMPGGWKPYQLLITGGYIPARVLSDHTQTIEQARLFNSVVRLGF